MEQLSSLKCKCGSPAKFYVIDFASGIYCGRCGRKGKKRPLENVHTESEADIQSILSYAKNYDSNMNDDEIDQREVLQRVHEIKRKLMDLEASETRARNSIDLQFTDVLGLVQMNMSHPPIDPPDETESLKDLSIAVSEQPGLSMGIIQEVMRFVNPKQWSLRSVCVKWFAAFHELSPRFSTKYVLRVVMKANPNPTKRLTSNHGTFFDRLFREHESIKCSVEYLAHHSDARTFDILEPMLNKLYPFGYPGDPYRKGEFGACRDRMNMLYKYWFRDIDDVYKFSSHAEWINTVRRWSNKPY